MPTPKSRQKLLEQFLTDANNRMAALSELVSLGIEYDTQAVLNRYILAVQKLVATLETDKTGRIVASVKNAQVLKELEILNEGLKGTAKLIAENAWQNTGKLLKGLSDWMAKASEIAGIVGEIAPLTEAMKGSMVKMATQMKPETFQSGLDRMMGEISAGVADSVMDGIRQYATSKERLNAILFTDEPAEALRKRTEGYVGRAERGAANLKRDIDRIEKGIEDLEKVRDNVNKQMSDYKAARKEFLSGKPNQGQVVRNGDSLGARTAQEARRRIMDEQQNAVVQAARERFGDEDEIVYVNAKNTDYDDNCYDAAEEEPMTLAEWEASAYGPPRSPKRDCGDHCKCVLIPVGTKKEQVVASGEQISEF